MCLIYLYLIFTFCIKQSNFLQLENDDFVAKDDSLTFLTHLATEHVENTFRSGEEQVTKSELLRSFADRVHKHLPHEEANLHPGMKSHLNRPKYSRIGVYHISNIGKY